MVRISAFSAAISLELYMQSENWMAAQWMLLDDETKDEWMEEEEPESLASLIF